MLRHPWLAQLREWVCEWPLVGRGQIHCWTPYSVQDSLTGRISQLQCVQVKKHWANTYIERFPTEKVEKWPFPDLAFSLWYLQPSNTPYNWFTMPFYYVFTHQNNSEYVFTNASQILRELMHGRRTKNICWKNEWLQHEVHGNNSRDHLSLWQVTWIPGWDGGQARFLLPGGPDQWLYVTFWEMLSPACRHSVMMVIAPVSHFWGFQSMWWRWWGWLFCRAVRRMTYLTPKQCLTDVIESLRFVQRDNLLLERGETSSSRQIKEKSSYELPGMWNVPVRFVPCFLAINIIY